MKNSEKNCNPAYFDLVNNFIKKFWRFLLSTGIWGFILLSGAFAQNSAQLTFDQANDALEAGNIQQALEHYQELEKEKQISGPLYLNLAICYSQLDSLGKAKFYFLKSSRFEETESRAEEGLEYIETQFSRQSAVLPKLPWEKAVDWLRIDTGASNLLFFAIIMINLGTILFVTTWFFRLPFNKWIFKSGLSIAALGLIIVLLSFYVNYVDQRYSEAVMVHQQSRIMEKPDAEAPVVNQAYEGYSFTVDHYKSREQPGWSYVRMSNGVYGWIPDSDILIL